VKRVLVTGAGGFIGRQTLIPLLTADCEIHAASLTIPEDAPPGIHWYSHNLLQGDEVNDLFRTVRPTHLLHLAWYAEPGKFWNAPENRQWVESGKTLIDAFCCNGGQRAVFAGTCAEYETGHGQCIENQTPIKPATLYGICKNELHQFAAGLAERNDFSMAWGRVFHLYGPHEHPQRFVPSVICSLLRGDEARCTEGTQIRDFMQVRDVAAAFVALLLCPVEGAVNIASGRPVRLADMARRIAVKLGAEELLKLGVLPIPPGEPSVLTASVERLNHEVSWVPTISLEQGLDEAIAWWKGRSL
jgi:nucleoside-diphosphate-sugar epimerase